MGWFFHTALDTIIGIENLNTANVTQMGWMFNNCSSLGKILVSSGWQVSANTTTSYMFANCGVSNVTYSKEENN